MELLNSINSYKKSVEPNHIDAQVKALERMVEEGAKEERIITKIEKRLAFKGIDSFIRISYDPISGVGYNMTRKFKFKPDSNKKLVFDQLYKKINKRLSRQDILIIIGFYKDYEKPDSTRKNQESFVINDIATTIREKTRFTTEQLIMNSGNLTLVIKKDSAKMG